jgi:YD repeat-containing protein
MGSYGISVWHYADHYYYSGGKRLKTSSTSYSTNGINTLSSVKNYHYDNTDYPSFATRIETDNSKGEILSTAVKHPFDYPGVHPYDDMLSNNLISPMVEQTVTNLTLNKEMSHAKTNYYAFPGVIAPQTVQSSVLGNPLETEATIASYDSEYPDQITDRNGVIISYLHDFYTGNLLAKIIGKDYDTVTGYLSSQGPWPDLSNDAVTRAYFGTLRAHFPDTQVSTYTYKPLVGMTSATDPKGQTSYYEYDSFQRLINIKDQDGKVLKHMDYHYQGQ